MTGGGDELWLALSAATGGLPANTGLTLNQQGLDAGLRQWPESPVEYSYQGDIRLSNAFILLSPMATEDVIFNFYKSTNGLYYNTLSECVYFPAEADGSAPNNAKVFLDIVRQLCTQSPPADTPCTSWTRLSSPTGPITPQNTQLLLQDIQTAPFITTANDLLDKCLVEASFWGASPLFETAYQIWLQNCSEPDDPVVSLPPITSAPVDVVNPTPNVVVCDRSRGYVPTNSPGGPGTSSPGTPGCTNLFAN
jgi:hypothetical protein